MDIIKKGLAFGVATVLAASQAISAQDALSQRQNYTFKQEVQPERLVNYYYAIYYTSGNGAYTTRGHNLATLGKEVLDFVFNPAGTSYVLISQGKKEPMAAVYSPLEENQKLFDYKNKKYGVPTSATFTPDARKMLISTDKRINVFDARTFELLDTLPIDITPTRMSMSSNGYYIVMTDGNNVVVYNYENKRPRHTMKYEDKVTDAKFNEDASELAVLTEDGVMSIYDTRNFIVKKTIDDIDGGIGMDYNTDGKYVAIATTPNKIDIINLLDPTDRDSVIVEEGGVIDVEFVPDVTGHPILVYTSVNKIKGDRMNKLAPYYGRLVQDEANERLNEWLKMMPGESLEEYNLRVTDENRAMQLRLYEDEISTRYADDLLTMSNISLGSYDRTNQVLELGFDNMPSIFLPVAEADLGHFTSIDDLEFRNAKYGVTSDDKFELIYAEVYNRNDGKTYTYDNIERVPLNFMQGDDNVVSIEVIQQQQMEEVKLQEIKETVIEEAKQSNIISEHTNISVDSRVDPDYDSDGNKILNYKVKFTYEVDPEFTVTEDFAPGKYRAEQSGAASSMLKIVKQAFEGDFAQYLKDGKKVIVKISGTADATPIVSRIIYDGCYGDFVEEPVYQDGQLAGLTVKSKEPITKNEQLAFLRAVGVKNYLENNVEKMKDMNTDYQYYITVSEGKGSQFRRITTEFTFVDAF